MVTFFDILDSKRMGEDSGSSVTVAVRLRPMNNREKALGTSCCVQMRDNQTILTNIQGHVAHKTDKVKTFIKQK